MVKVGFYEKKVSSYTDSYHYNIYDCGCCLSAE